MQIEFSNLPNFIQIHIMTFLDIETLKLLRTVDKRVSNKATDILFEKVEKQQIWMSESYFFKLLIRKVENILPNEMTTYFLHYINRVNFFVFKHGITRCSCYKKTDIRNDNYVINPLYPKITITIPKGVDRIFTIQANFALEHIQRNHEKAQKEFMNNPKNFYSDDYDVIKIEFLPEELQCPLKKFLIESIN